MPHSFDIVTDSTASVERVHAAFGCAEYWHARHAEFDAASTLDSLTVDGDGAVEVRLTQHLGRRFLPAALAQLLPGDLKIQHGEVWKPVGDNRVQGQVEVTAPASVGSGRLDAWLTPAPTGSQLRFTATVDVNLPLLGGRLERSIGSDLTENIRKIQRFTDAWIDEHPEITNPESRR